MSVLENKIKKNREQFDITEPREGHLDRFAGKLDALHQQEPEHMNTRFFAARIWRIAAVIIVLLSISTIVYIVNPNQSSVNVTAHQLPPEVEEVKMYYNGQATTKLKRIEQCAMNDENAALIHEMAAQELSELEES